MSDTYEQKGSEDAKNAEHIFEMKGIKRFSERLKETIGDISIRAFAKKCSISEAVVRNYLAGKTYPSLDKLELMAQVGNKSLEWLCAGVEEACENKKSSQHTSSIIDSEFALIPGYRIQVSAGHGSLNPHDLEPTRYLAFRRKWLKYRRFNEKDLAIVWAKGDSMEPTIHNNDTLVVNMERKKPSDGHIYIFRNGDELFVKRYQSVLGAWRLISDNPLYDNQDIPKDEQHQFEVIGQVIHIAKDLGD